MDSVTEERVRPITTFDLGEELSPDDLAELGLPDPGGVIDPVAGATSPEEFVEPLPDGHELLVEAQAALAMDFAGVILSGPPGTGKSYYARRLAHTIANDPEAVRVVQFHPSYQYEDFMEGYAPGKYGGSTLEKKVFAQLCEDAGKRLDVQHVLLIDEISRCDVARVFGEALTYLEPDKRSQKFRLASGSTLSVPPNLVILATMNPWDKGVDELDMALERRFAEVDVPPSATALREILAEKGAAPDHIDRVVRLFEAIRRDPNELVRVGHAYFGACVDEESTRRAWRLRPLPTFKKACRLDEAALGRIKTLWTRVFPDPPAAEAASDGVAQVDPGGRRADEVPPAPPEDQR